MVESRLYGNNPFCTNRACRLIENLPSPNTMIRGQTSSTGGSAAYASKMGKIYPNLQPYFTKRPLTHSRTMSRRQDWSNNPTWPSSVDLCHAPCSQSTLELIPTGLGARSEGHSPCG